MTVLHECLDNDSPYLICKHCGAVGRCDLETQSDSPPTRESVSDALMIVESYGPWGADLNDAHRRQIVLADEVKRLQQDAYALATMLTEANRKLAGYTK